MTWVASGYWKTQQAVDDHGRMDDPGTMEKAFRFRETRFENTGNDSDAAERQALQWLEVDGATSATFWKEDV